MIEAERLTRAYGSFVAVDDVSFRIGAGEVVGLLGHNGAGKTTIMKMLTGYLEPSAGVVRIDGADLEDDLPGARAKMGYLPENAPTYPEMTVVDYLDFVAELRGVAPGDKDRAIREAIGATDLFEKAGDRIAALSRGFRQRVGVAQAILHSPRIVILDEPTNGLDPSQIQSMRALIRRLADRDGLGATVILSTHILQEVQAVCERAIIVNRGKIGADFRLQELAAERRLRVRSTLPADGAAAAFAAIAGVQARVLAAAAGAPQSVVELSLGSQELDAVAPAAARIVLERGADLIALEPARRELEDVFAEISSGRTAPGAAEGAAADATDGAAAQGEAE